MLAVVGSCIQCCGRRRRRHKAGDNAQTGSGKGGNREPLCFPGEHKVGGVYRELCTQCTLFVCFANRLNIQRWLMRIQTPTSSKEQYFRGRGGLFNRAEEDCYVSPPPSRFHLHLLLLLVFFSPRYKAPSPASTLVSGPAPLWTLRLHSSVCRVGVFTFFCLCSFCSIFVWAKKNNPERLNPLIDLCIWEFTLPDARK